MKKLKLPNPKFNFKNWIKPLLIIISGFVAGLIGAIIILNIAGVSLYNASGSNTKVTTSSTTYTNTSDTTEAIAKVQDAVVSVINYQTESTSSANDIYSQMFGGDTGNSSSGELSVYSEGSGVIYKIDGDSAYIVTNTHVVDGAEQIEIMLADGTKVIGDLIGSDKLKTVAEFADSDSLTVGETAIAIGSPLGTDYANSVTQGIVSSLSRTVTMTNDDGQTISTNAIQTDAAINPGNSGGALINIEGQVIGINSSKISSTSSSSSSGDSVEGMGFAIPSNDVVKIITQLEESGEVVRPALGISMVDLSNLSTNSIAQLNIPTSITSGVVVASVQSGMPADGKLEQYDVITEIDGKEVTSTSDLQSILYVGDSIELTFYRGTDKKTATVELSKTTQDLTN